MMKLATLLCVLLLVAVCACRKHDRERGRNRWQGRGRGRGLSHGPDHRRQGHRSREHHGSRPCCCDDSGNDSIDQDRPWLERTVGEDWEDDDDCSQECPYGQRSGSRDCDSREEVERPHHRRHGHRRRGHRGRSRSSGSREARRGNHHRRNEQRSGGSRDTDSTEESYPTRFFQRSLKRASHTTRREDGRFRRAGEFGRE